MKRKNCQRRPSVNTFRFEFRLFLSSFICCINHAISQRFWFTILIFRLSFFSQHRATTAVYQVTRPGHEHCDATEGILLDITPLVVDRRKFVTLYDKDLTEGVNLLIGKSMKFCSHWIYSIVQCFHFEHFPVVSDLWGSQCVRLKVTVKSDNCGENAECSNKGVCYSNASMVSANQLTFVSLF